MRYKKLYGKIKKAIQRDYISAGTLIYSSHRIHGTMQIVEMT